MLNSTTKNRINSCRDILVGKIPDPKGQIDQITNALVYKFMDDQDRMSRELSYDASFFTGDYAQYAWSRLFDTKLTNQDRANLYIEGLDRLSRADHLPDLFKQIFKDAYLPFRDANTIVMFLTEIHGFDYHHSEELGNAFEYLLSIMGSQGDAGQFRTPRHIIEFLVDVVDPQKHETILDPACGTAGFLVEAFKHITAKGDLGVQDVAKLAESITGVDIDPGMAKIARVNLYLHGFKTPKITENDTLTDEKLWGTKYDVILANPPFMTPKGGIQPHDKFAIRANRAEVLFTDYIAEHLRLHGRAGIIVPEGIIFQGSNAYKDLRKMLVDDGYLWAVVSLPSGCFNPYSGVKTTILFLDRERAKNNDSILFVKISADGYDLGAQRREINKNDLPKALEILNIYKENTNLLESHPELVSGSSNIAHIVEKSRIAEGGDYNLSGDRYIASTGLENSSFKMVDLNEVCAIERGASPRPIEKYITNDETGVNWIKIGDTKGIGKLICRTEEKITLEGASKSRKVNPGDFILSNSMSFGKPFIMGIEGYVHDGWLILRTDPGILNKDYLYYILSSEGTYNQFLGLATGGVVKNLNSSLVKSVKIPLPPLEIQEQIVAELDGYQRIIDGARAVVEDYKPMIRIDPEWEMFPLGDIVQFIDYRGKTPEKTESGIPLITAKNIRKGYIDIEPREYIAENDYESWMSRGIPPNGSVVFTTEAPLGNVAQLCFDYKIALAQRVITFVPFEPKKLLDSFLLNVLLTDDIQKSIFNRQSGTTVYGIKASELKLVEIPLPPLEIQQSIVERIEEEQRLVDANRRLIEIFEGKIREKMDEVWGVK